MKNTAVAFLILTVIALVIFAPFLLIWSLNTLFALGIEYTVWTWLAALVLTGTFGKTTIKTDKT